MCIGHIHNIVKQLSRHRLGDAFEALLDLGDEMHDMVDDFGGFGDLHQVNRLLTSIVHHCAYGIYEHVDQVIHALLLLAIRTCDKLRTAQTQPGPDRVFWLSPTQSEINDHLEVYRNFLGYIANWPDLPSSQDPNLQSAKQLLQKLRPRINIGLAHYWGRPAEVRAKTDAIARRRHTLRSSTQRRPSGITKPSSSPRPQPPRKTAAAFMPTPPSQSGDVGLEATVPTIPAYCPGRIAPVPDSLSNTMGRDDFRLGGATKVVDEMDQALMSPLELVVDGGKGRAARANASHLGTMHEDAAAPNTQPASIGTFKLRPEHCCSPRCCPLRGRY
jgi:hypothetical protein